MTYTEVAELIREAEADGITLSIDQDGQLLANGDGVTDQWIERLREHSGDVTAYLSGVLGDDTDMPEPIPSVRVDAPETRPVDGYRSFPAAALPSPLRELVTEGASAIGCDEAYIALPLLSCVGSAIGGACRLVVKSGWTVPPVIWSLIIGESGTAKSPAFRLVKSPIEKHQRTLLDQHSVAMDQYEDELAAYENAKTQHKKDGHGDAPERPEPPACGRCMVSDTTVEALAPMLRDSPRGVLVQRDELSGWFGSFAQYKKGAKGADEAHWLSMYDGESITVDRKQQGTRPIYVPSAMVSITGGIQPAILQRAMGRDHRASGMAARFLVAHPPRRSIRWTDDEVSQATQLRIDRLITLLYGIDYADGHSVPHYIGMSRDAQAVYRQYYDMHQSELEDLTGDHAAAWSKLLGYVPRLALVIHVCRQTDIGGDITQAVAPETVQDAITVVRWACGEAMRLYATIDDTDDQRELRELAAWITRRHGGECTPRQMVQGVHRIRDVADAETEAARLVAAGLAEWGLIAPESGRGPQRRVVRIRR